MRTLAVVLLSSLWLAGCGGREPPASRSTERAASSGPLETGLQIGNLAPEIEGVDLDGVPFRLGDYRGKVVALVFWGDW